MDYDNIVSDNFEDQVHQCLKNIKGILIEEDININNIIKLTVYLIDLSNFDKLNKSKHVIAVNEGSAVSIGIGNYLSTKKISCVYLQNSGLGNTINPLTSLNYPFKIPILLITTWRGDPII